MIRDAQTNLWEAAALTVTGVSTNTYDCGAVPAGGTGGSAPDISAGHPLVAVLSVGVAAKVSATNETYEFDIIQSVNAALTSPDLLAQYTFTNAQAAAILTLGSIVVLPIPQQSITKRYLGAQAVLGGTSPSITVTAWVTSSAMVQLTARYYTSLINIL